MVRREGWSVVAEIGERILAKSRRNRNRDKKEGAGGVKLEGDKI